MALSIPDIPASGISKLTMPLVAPRTKMTIHLPGATPGDTNMYNWSSDREIRLGV